MFDALFPHEASEIASRVDLVFLVLTSLSGLITLLVVGGLTYLGIRYYHGREVDRSNRIFNRPRLEFALIVVLAVLATATFVWAGSTYVSMVSAPRSEDPLELFVVARQWMWEIHHPSGRRELNELHVPVDRSIRITASSEDVIHSFYVPAFRVKRDVVPGRYTSLWLRPTRTGTYPLFCAEYCGVGHSKMLARVVVTSPAAYEDWLSGATDRERRDGETLPPRAGASPLEDVNPGDVPALVGRGARLFSEFGCNQCHGANAPETAPVLRGIVGTPRRLSDGRTVLADEQYLRRAILAPTAQVVAGYEAIMPPYEGQLTEVELRALVEYVSYLSRPSPS